MQSEIEALRTLKAQYCRLLDTRDRDGWRSLFADDLVVRLDMAPATLGGDPQTAPPIEGADTFVSYTLGALELTSDDTATGIWAMEDWLIFPNGAELHGAGHYHETYRTTGDRWQITSLHLTRTVVKVTEPTA